MKTKRILSLLLAFLMVFTMIPGSVFAEAAAEDAAAPESITIDVVNTKRCIGDDRSILVSEPGGTFQFKAYDENGEETPVTWSSSSSYAGTFGEGGLFTLGSTYSGSSSFTSITATSTLDESVSETKRYTVAGFAASEYSKNKTVALSTDGQTAKTITATGGYNGYCVWSYDEEAAKGIAVPDADPTTSTSWKFNVYRPGSFQATAAATFDPELTTTNTLTITGVAVEDLTGTQGKVYLETTSKNPSPTTQLAAFVQDGRTVSSWESSKTDVATVDANGLVTAVGVGTTQITVTDSAGTKGGIRVVVKDGETPYFESLEFLTTALSNWTAGSTFNPKTFSYDLSIKAATTTQLTLQATTLYDTDKHIATAKYTNIEGNAEEVLINSGKITYLKNIPFDDFDVIITIADRENPENKTDYVFHVNRPRDTTKVVKSSGIVLVPEGRSLYTNTVKYNNYAEGTFLKANEEGTLTSDTGVTGTQYYYKTYLLGGTESFALNVTGNTAYMHLRYSIGDDGEWKELASGSNTNFITFPTAEDGNPVQKVRIQILDDKTYHDNIVAGKGGFDEGTPNEYIVWVEQVQTSPKDAAILSFTGEGGDWYPETVKDGITTYNMVVPAGTTSATIEYTVTDGASVKVGTAAQEADENGMYQLVLKSTAQTINITSADGALVNAYNFKYIARSSWYDVPDKVVDYIVPNSQYTNGGNGTNPETTLAGTFESLGNFGGYITYYYEKPLTNSSKNLYGIDFFVYGNSQVDTTTATGCSFFEPGQVWVSENGSDWYALAGSEHYEKTTVWDYEVTYTRTASGKTAWADNQGNSNAGTSYCGNFVNPNIYYMNQLMQNNSVTLKGICLPNDAGEIASYGSAVDANHVSWGYADCFANGTKGEAVNPYLDNSDHKLQANGFDLEWAVDAEGNPIDVSDKEFHYVKVVTASNMWHPSFGDKSTEVSYVVRANEVEESVGRTADTTGVTISNGEKTKNVFFEDGKQVYEVDVEDMKYVSLQVNGACEEDNIYINNQRISYLEAVDGIKVTKEGGETLVRVIVQKGEMEPEIYLLRLTGSASESDELIESVRAKMNESSRYLTTKDGEHYELTVAHRIDSISLNPIVKDGVVYTIYAGSDTSVTAPKNQASYELAYGENIFTIVAADNNSSRKQAVTVAVTREAAPVLSGETIDVTFSLYGDSRHGNIDTPHTYQKNKEELEVWIDEVTYTVPKESTVLDVLEKAFDDNGIPYTNADGNYISRINGLAEFDNGALSGWLFMINGRYPDKGVAGQTLNDGDEIILHYTDDYTQEHLINSGNAQTADGVIALIDAIGEVTLESKDAINAARRGYDGLTDTQKELVTNYAVLEEAEAVYAELKKAQDALDAHLQKVTEVYEAAGAYLAALKPGTGMIGGEWMVLGLARAGANLSAEYRRDYRNKVIAYIRENCNEENRLHNNKSSENSRVILALTALGYDPERLGGRNLLSGLSDMDYVKKQGINGSIWALIAFDSKNYEIPALKGEGTQTTREGLITEILQSQLEDGGFALAGETADADITGMALQALAPYYATREDVKEAVDKALACLSDMQLATGGYASWGKENMESNVQVLVGLSALGIDARKDERFIKNGNNLLDAILGFALEDGSFAHEVGGTEANQMSTEQGYYALTAYYRMLNGENRLYDMSDVEIQIIAGDANGDGQIKTDDALAILKYVASLKQEYFLEQAANCDGKAGISTSDALAVLKYVAGITKSFPVEG